MIMDQKINGTEKGIEIGICKEYEKDINENISGNKIKNRNIGIK